MSSDWVFAIETAAFFGFVMIFGAHQLWELRQLAKGDAAKKKNGEEKPSTPAQPNL